MTRRYWLACLFVLSLAWTAALTADEEKGEPAVRQLAQRYFAAYAAKDLNGFMALWSDKAPDFKSRKETMRRIFAETKDIHLKTLTIVKIEVTGVSARLRVRVELVGENARTGKPHADLGRLNLELGLVREESVWKIQRAGSAEANLLARLFTADGKANRDRLYRQDKDLVTTQLASLAIRVSRERMSRRRFTEALQWNNLALEVAERLADKAALASCHFYRGSLFRAWSRYPEALIDYQRARILFQETKDRGGEGDALIYLGRVCQSMRRYKEALRYFEDSLKITRELRERAIEAITLRDMGIAHHSLGQYKEALQHYQDSLKIANALGNRAGEASARGNIGMVYQSTGRPQEALQQHETVLKIFRELGDRVGEALALHNIGSVYESLGQYPEALRHHQLNLQLARTRKDRDREAGTLNDIGIVYQATGHYPESLRHYEGCLKIAQELVTVP
jgi:tetratricopeptide (TPR) repeat protein